MFVMSNSQRHALISRYCPQRVSILADNVSSKRPIIGDRGLAKNVGEPVMVRVKNHHRGASRGFVLRVVSGLLVENNSITYDGQQRFAVEPEGGGRKVNLYSGRTLVGLRRDTSSAVYFYNYI